MKAEARQFHRAAFMALRHAHQHAGLSGDLDSAQVVLSSDYAAEMLLKAVLLERGESIMLRAGYSTGLLDALKRCGPYKHGSLVQILREHRDNLQHLAMYTDHATAQDFYEGILLFVEEVSAAEFAEGVPIEFSTQRRPTAAPSRGSEIVWPAQDLQRDVHAFGATVVWSQGAPDGTLAVHVKIGDEDARRLTPSDAFEYLPKTDGRHVAVYRQSGGVILYDLADGSREIISERGGPTAVLGGYIAAQGLEIAGGLGGGVWLRRISSGTWEPLSPEGDSARLTESHAVWQEYGGGERVVRARRLEGGEPTSIARGAAHPSPWGGRVAWTDAGVAEPGLHVTDFQGNEVFSAAPGISPSLVGPCVAYLRPNAGGYDLVVTDVDRKVTALEIADVGFPIGNGPVISEKWVYFESSTGGALHAIYRARLR